MPSRLVLTVSLVFLTITSPAFAGVQAPATGGKAPTPGGAAVPAPEPPPGFFPTPRYQKELAKLAARPQPNEFEVAVEAARTRLSAARAEQAAAFDAGNLEALLGAYRAAVPNREKDAAEALAFAGALVGLDPAAAEAQVNRAFELAPKERAVIAARGRALHRQGRFLEAADAYQAAIDAGHMDTLVLYGLRAAALLEAGKIDDALAAWQSTNAFQARTDLENALRDVHERTDKDVQRVRLVAKVRAGELDALEPLLLLDLSWTNDDKDYPLSHREHVAHDLALAAEKLGKDSRRYVELEFLANGRMGMEPRPKDAPPPPDVPVGRGEGTGFGAALPPSAVEKGGRKLGFMGWGKDKKNFPQSSVLAPAIYKMLFLDGDIVSTEWVGWFDAEMRTRATSEKGDLDCALLLMDLYEESIVRKFDGWEKLPDKLAEWQTTTWTRYKDVRVAQRILAWRGKDLTADDPVLKEAVERFGDDVKIVNRAIDAARKSGGKVPENLFVASARAAFKMENALEANRALSELRALRMKQAEPAPAEPKDGAPAPK